MNIGPDAEASDQLTQRETIMRELTSSEIAQVSGGLAPLAVIAVDLALNATFIGATALLTSDYFQE